MDHRKQVTWAILDLLTVIMAIRPIIRPNNLISRLIQHLSAPLQIQRIP